MTEYEAIKQLKITDCRNCEAFYYCDMLIEEEQPCNIALNKAIEALEKQSRNKKWQLRIIKIFQKIKTR
jgi:hypothetical protein